MEEVKNCLLCRREGNVFYSGIYDKLSRTGPWSFLKCEEDGLIWLSNRPTEKDFKKIYAEDYYTHKTEGQFGLKKIIIYPVLSSMFGYRFNFLVDFFGKFLLIFPFLKDIVGEIIMWLSASWKGKLLDVGCGNGIFLFVMRGFGWRDSIGLEPDATAVKIAKESRLNVFKGTLKDVKFPKNTFDVITMRHVIEHVNNPLDVLKECSRLLKRNGKLVIVTPNVNSLGHKLFKIKWSELDVPRHLFLFSRKTLLQCVKKAGLKISVCRLSIANANNVWPKNIKVKFFHKFNRLFQIFEYLVGNGEEILLVAYK